MSFEYRARIVVTTAMGDNGDAYKRVFNGTCAVGVNKRVKGSIAKRAEAYLEAVNKSQGTSAKVVTQKTQQLPKLEVVARVSHIPIVESGIELSEKIYHKIRESNPLIRWYCSLGERSLAVGAQLALPAVVFLEKPISQLDWLLCRSLDVVEHRVPSIYLPPETMYSETRRYVLRRADSVKQIGNAVLDSRVTAATAEALDRVLCTADKYVDKYLPPDNQDAADVTAPDEVDSSEADSGLARAAHAVQHGARLRRKLQRRLTRQALAEAKAIKEQIHVLAYVAELVATDPVLAWQKAKQLFVSLSGPEPENQARPATVEEMMVLLIRETARRVVHLFNYTHNDLPKNVLQGMSLVTNHLSTTTESLIKTVHLHTAMDELRTLRRKLEILLGQLQKLSKIYLENLAVFLAGNEEREKIAPRSTPAEQRDNLAINGVN